MCVQVHGNNCDRDGSGVVVMFDAMVATVMMVVVTVMVMLAQMFKRPT